MSTTGTFALRGAILARNAGDAHAEVKGTSGKFGGTIAVTYHGGLQTILENPRFRVAIRNVRRLRYSRPPEPPRGARGIFFTFVYHI